jgi:hypothetical protein
MNALEVSWARWRSTVEQAADSVVERWSVGVRQDAEAGAVALHLARWWLEEGDIAQCRRYAWAAVALDPQQVWAVERMFGWLAPKCKPPRRAWLVAALVADLEGA